MTRGYRPNLRPRGNASKQPIENLKPCISWAGGKSRLLKFILPLIPEHRCYAEPFGGGLAVFLAKPRSPVEAINDINADLVNFYRVARFHPEALAAELKLALHSREDFYAYRQQPGLTDIQRAARWFFVNKESFGGGLDSFGISPASGPCSLLARIPRLAELSARLDKVYIENLDWRKFLSLYDRKETFFFLDPPYVGCGASNYQPWSMETVGELRDVLFRLKGKWLLTLNDAVEIRSLFADCTVRPVERANGINHRTQKNPIYREIIITPPD